MHVAGVFCRNNHVHTDSINAFEMEWSDDLVLRLINLYQAKPCLYDVREKDYHNRQKKKLAFI